VLDGVPFFENGLRIHQYQSYPVTTSIWDDRGIVTITNNVGYFPNGRLPPTTLQGDLIVYTFTSGMSWSCGTFNGMIFEFLFTKAFTNVIDLDNSGYVITFDATHIYINSQCTSFSTARTYRFQIVHPNALVTE